MKKINFKEMSQEEFNAYCPRNESEESNHRAESEFREYCQDQGVDFEDESEREGYNEMLEETGDKFWDNCSEDDKAGWIDNMNKY